MNFSDNNSLEFLIPYFSDSRCPAGAYCIWQGEANVKIEMKKPYNDPLLTSSHFNSTDTLNNYVFNVVDVAPYPELNKPISSTD